MEFEIIKTQTNMGKKSIIVDGFTIRKDSQCSKMWRYFMEMYIKQS